MQILIQSPSGPVTTQSISPLCHPIPMAGTFPFITPIRCVLECWKLAPIRGTKTTVDGNSCYGSIWVRSDYAKRKRRLLFFCVGGDLSNILPARLMLWLVHTQLLLWRLPQCKLVHVWRHLLCGKRSQLTIRIIFKISPNWNYTLMLNQNTIEVEKQLCYPLSVED